METKMVATGRCGEGLMWYLRIVVAIAGLILFASGCGGGGDAVTPDFDETQYVGIVRGSVRSTLTWMISNSPPTRFN